ncbi:MAG: hypothetical protein KF832_24890 [Caldilineaceae bacterium]|nr:hypothetical protein [Caldilineaceae bacterium]
MVVNHLLLLGTVGWFAVMLTLTTYYILIVDRIKSSDFEEEPISLSDGETVYLPSSMYPHNEFMQVTTMPFIHEQPEAFPYAG